MPKSGQRGNYHFNNERNRELLAKLKAIRAQNRGRSDAVRKGNDSDENAGS